jgi:adenylosuccinate synthase
MAVDLLLGLQWEMKERERSLMFLPQYDIIARFQGTKCRTHLEFDGIKHVLRTIPSGIFIKQL